MSSEADQDDVAAESLSAQLAKIDLFVRQTHLGEGRIPDVGIMRPHYFKPVPISSTRSPGLTFAAPIISATMYGCEIVWPASMGSGESS